MATASYQYKWEGDTLVIRYKKRRRTITAQLGDVKFSINRRTLPKKYMFVVTGKANARKGILPNSLTTLQGRWAFMPQKLIVQKKNFKDDFGTTNQLTIPEFDKNNSFDNQDGTVKFDGALILNAGRV